MRTLTIFMVLAVLSVQGQAQQNFKTLDSALSVIAKEEMFHGQVLIAENGEIRFLKSYGKTLQGQAYMNTTPIDIQSVAKGITALSILQLHEQGKLNLNDPLAKYFPSLSFYRGVQLKHILNHTSGLPRFFEVVFANWPHDQFLSTKEMVELLARLKPGAQSKTGEFEAYNQTAYMLLADIVEQVTDMSFTDYVRQQILEPADMTETYFNIEQPDYKTQLGEANIDNLFALMVGDGGMKSTAEDLYRLDRAIAEGTIITPIVMNQAYRPMTLGDGEEGRYGYGGSLVEKKMGQRQFQHIGQGVSSNAVVTRYIDEGNLLVVLHDQSVQYALPVYQAIQNIWKVKPFEMPEKRVLHQLTEEQIAKYVGDYGDNGFMHLTTEDGKLYIQPDGNPSRVEIIPSSDTTFYFEDQDMNWEIYLDDQGNVIGFGPLGQKDFMMKRWKK